MARIGVNALYLIPGGVGGTEIYLRELLAALATIDTVNDIYVFTNMETAQDLTPRQANFHWKPQAVQRRESAAPDSVGADRAAARSRRATAWRSCSTPDSRFRWPLRVLP